MLRTLTVDEFREELKSQGVATIDDAAVVCPMCGTVQSIRSLMAAGAKRDEAERKIAFSCIGRITGAGAFRPGQQDRKGAGCDWTLGGLFKIHAIEVVTEDGVHHPRFAPASTEQAQALAAALSGDAAP